MGKLIRGGTVLATLAAAAIAPWTVGSVSASGGATRYASPTSLDTTGSCSQASPCEIHHAISGAASGDTVIVEPGDYHVSTSLVESAPITLTGQSGQPFPHLIGDPTLTSPTLEVVGGMASRLYVETTASDGLALDLQGGSGSQLTLVDSGGDHEGGAAQLESSPGGTLLQDSVARVVGSEGEAIELLNGSGTGSSELVNVTSVGGLNTTAIESKADTAVAKNTIFQGGAYDVHVPAGHLTVSYSNFRPAASDGYTDGGHNQATAPLFADPLTGDFHEASSSPTVDAGVSDPSAGSVDLDGLSRVSGPAPDIGAYEHQVSTPVKVTAAPAASDPFSLFASSNPSLTNLLPVHRPAPKVTPQPGKTFYAASFAGHALVRLPGSHEFVPFSSLSPLPVGSTLDARSAVIWLFTARDSSGTPQNALLYGSKVTILQRPGGDLMTNITLTGGDFASCPGRGAHSAGTASAARAHTGHTSRHIVRRLWAADNNGRFRTHGANSVATVRGTDWRVDDRCDGTLTKVFQGQVLVRDRRRHKTVVVTAHHHYVAYR